MYCTISNAYGSSISGIDDSESNDSSSTKTFDKQLFDHRYCVEQFEKYRESKILKDNFDILQFNKISEHINNCYSCKMYITQKTSKEVINEKKEYVNDVDIKDLVFSLMIGIIIILIIELIMNTI